MNTATASNITNGLVIANAINITDSHITEKPRSDLWRRSHMNNLTGLDVLNRVGEPLEKRAIVFHPIPWNVDDDNSESQLLGIVLMLETFVNGDQNVISALSLGNHPGDWLTYNGNLNGNRYSDLKVINTSNVQNLGVKWIFPVDHFGLEVTPMVADGVMYITGPNQAIALDALTGRQIWKYARPRTAGLIGDASLGTNRGVAILGDKVFMVTDNAHLLAINRITGSLVWDRYMPDEPCITVPPSLRWR